jgi:GNAT superfamily N-acetyltransferase
VLCVSLASVHVTPAFAAAPDGGPISRAEYEACQARDEGGFRLAVEALTSKALQKGLATIDYKSVVDSEWRKAGIDQLLDKRIDAAVAEVADQTGLGDKALSVWSKEKAAEMATSVAERVYKSDAFKTSIEALANGAGVYESIPRPPLR